MIDLDFCSKAVRVKWIKKYLQCDSQAMWKKSFEYICKVNNLPVFCLSNYTMNELPNTLPIYYKESFKYWKNIKSEVINCKQDLNNQFIWYNRNILICDKTNKLYITKHCLNAGFGM